MHGENGHRSGPAEFSTIGLRLYRYPGIVSFDYFDMLQSDTCFRPGSREGLSPVIVWAFKLQLLLRIVSSGVYLGRTLPTLSTNRLMAGVKGVCLSARMGA